MGKNLAWGTLRYTDHKDENEGVLVIGYTTGQRVHIVHVHDHLVDPIAIVISSFTYLR